MKKKFLFLFVVVSLLCLMAISVNAERYTPTFGPVSIVDSIAEPTILDTTSRVVMTDGTTYPAYYILNDSTSFSPNFGKLNNALKALGQEASYDRGKVKALEIPEGIINLPSCYNAGGFFQGDKYVPTIEYLRLPSTLETMGDAAIFRIKSLKVIDNFENTKVVNIPTRLEGLSSLQYIHLPNTVKTIPATAFKDCSSVEYIILGSSIEEINTQAFLYAGKDSGKSSLKVYVSNTLLKIQNSYGDGILQGSHSVVVLYYTGTLTDVGMQQMITGTGIKKGASKWNFVDASAKDFDKNAEYTTNTIIYNYNMCDAFYNGVHSIKEKNNCLVYCENCEISELKENPIHENVIAVEKGEYGYFDSITVKNACANCGNIDSSENISAMFVSLGYSACTYGDNFSVTQGFKVNNNAIDRYKSYVPDFEFGFLATVNAAEKEEAVAISPSLDDANVISASMNDMSNDYLEIKIIGINGQNKDTLIIFCIYVLDGDSLCYLDNNVESDSIKGVSYNGVLKINGENID